MATPSASDRPRARHSPRFATCQSTTGAMGSAKASMVSGRVMAPQPMNAASISNQRVPCVSRHRMRAHQLASQSTPVVTSEKYAARHTRARGAVSQTNHARSATQPSDRRRASTNTSAPAMPPRMTDGRPGSPSQTPGTMRIAWPGGIFGASTGVTSTAICSQNSGSGGAGAVQCPDASMLAWSWYAASS